MKWIEAIKLRAASQEQAATGELMRLMSVIRGTPGIVEGKETK